jgi:hypothetical protein
VNVWAAWAITGGLGVAIPQAQQLARWWSGHEDARELTARRLKLRRGKLLESAMNVPILLGLVAVFLGADWRPALVAVAVVVAPLWAFQVRVRRTGTPATLTPPSVRSRAGERC